MTADIVNLRKARKAKVRAEATLLAAGNRVKYGRNKLERARNKAAARDRSVPMFASMR